mgnify:CR=1 FL=1
MKKTLAALAVLVVLPVVARAQKPVTDTEAIELTTKIEAIDKTARLLTLQGARVHVIRRAKTMEQALLQGLERENGA